MIGLGIALVAWGYAFSLAFCLRAIRIDLPNDQPLLWLVIGQFALSQLFAIWALAS